MRLHMELRLGALVAALTLMGPAWAAPEATPAPTAAPTAAAAAAPVSNGWTYAKYLDLFKKTGRNTQLTAEQFKDIQVRKAAMLKDLDGYLAHFFKKADPNVIRAFQDLPREYFQYQYQKKTDFSKYAYEYPPRTWGLGWGSALSDYHGQAFMAQVAHAKPTDRVLEVGTGSGFNISLLSRMVKEAYSIEIIQPLGEGVSVIFQPLGYDNIHTRVGDGYFGWPEVKGGFDIIMLTCVAQYVPPPLLEQLKPGGRLIIPIGQPFKHNQMLYVYRKDRLGRVTSRKVTPVFFIPMKGAMQDNPAPADGSVPEEGKKDAGKTFTPAAAAPKAPAATPSKK